MTDLEPSKIAAVLGPARVHDVAVLSSGSLEACGAALDCAKIVVVQTFGPLDVAPGLRAAEAALAADAELWIAYPTRSHRSHERWRQFIDAVRKCRRVPAACVSIDPSWSATLVIAAAPPVPRFSRALRIAQRHAALHE